MGVEIPVGFAEASFKWRLSGDAEEMVTTLGFRTNGTSRADLEAAFSDLVTEWNLAGLTAPGNMFVGWTFVGIDGRLNSSDAGETVITSAVNNDGTDVGETPPVNVAILVHKRSGLGGRKHRGRMYIPPASTAEGDISKLGIIATSAVNSLNTILAAFLTGFEAATAGNELVILHSNPLDTPTPITSFETDPLVATQRRRIRH